VSPKKNNDQPETGIVIYCEPTGQGHQLTIHLQFHDEGTDELNNAWVKSMFVSCISAENQLLSCCNILKSRTIFAGDLKHVFYGVPLITTRLTLDLSKHLDRRLVEEQYFITVSCRQYLSNTVTLKLEHSPG
jgi:hypothetical protein